MAWVINANSNTCKIYQYNQSNQHLTLIKEISHPESRPKKSIYLTSDKPGHYKNDTSGGGSYEPKTDAKENEIHRFAKEIAEIINHGRLDQSYKELILISEPHMNGLIMKNLDKRINGMLTHNIQKDVAYLHDHEMIHFLKEHTKLK